MTLHPVLTSPRKTPLILQATPQSTPRATTLPTTDIREIASVIGGSEKSRHGIVLAKSTLAKQYGIVTGEPLFQARRKCPGLVVVPPNYQLYVRKSDQLIRMLHEYTPLIQQYSIDEAWMDMTGIQEAQADPVGFATRLKDRDPPGTWIYGKYRHLCQPFAGEDGQRASET